MSVLLFFFDVLVKVFLLPAQQVVDVLGLALLEVVPATVDRAGECL